MESYETRHPDPAPLPAERLDATGYKSALAEARRLLGADAAPALDAVIHGVVVRLFSNSARLRRFWSANWFAGKQWATLTGKSPSDEPHVTVYAPVTEAEAPPWAAYSLVHDTGFLQGDMPYGALRALALGAVARRLAENEAVHFVPGVCLKQEGRGTLLLDARGMDRSAAADRSAAVTALLGSPGAHVAALNGVFVRYGLVRMVDGVTLLPIQVIDEGGLTTRGYRLFPWLDEYGFEEPRADTTCLTLEGDEEYVFARDLDLGRPPDVMAYPLEQAWYVPAQMAAAVPNLVAALGRADDGENGAVFENVPPLMPGLLERFGAEARESLASLRSSADPASAATLDEIGDDSVIGVLCRLRANSGARVMVAPDQLWPGRAGGHPWRPLWVKQVSRLTADGCAPIEPSALSEHLAGTSATLSGLYEPEIEQTLNTLLERGVRGLSG